MRIPLQDRSTPLHWAAMRGYVDVARLLMADPRIDVNVKDTRGCSPLHWTAIPDMAGKASRTGKSNAARLLLADSRVVVTATDKVYVV